MVKERAKSKFDETSRSRSISASIPRHADQMVRGVVILPNGTGRTLRVGVFAAPARKRKKPMAAGADDCRRRKNLVEKVQGGAITRSLYRNPRHDCRWSAAP